MDKLSERVKELMITHPMLYQTRFQALVALYSGDGGYHWDRDGTIVPDFRDDKIAEQMYYSDLDEREVRLAEYRAEPHADMSKDLYDRWEREIRLERLQRQFIETNIELVATTSPRFTSMINWASVIEDFSPEFPQFKPIYNVPANAEESFKQGAWELIDALVSRISAKDDCSTRAALVAQRKKILGITPEMEAAQVALVAELLGELKAEDTNNA